MVIVERMMMRSSDVASPRVKRLLKRRTPSGRSTINQCSIPLPRAGTRATDTAIAVTFAPDRVPCGVRDRHRTRPVQPPSTRYTGPRLGHHEVGVVTRRPCSAAWTLLLFRPRPGSAAAAATRRGSGARWTCQMCAVHRREPHPDEARPVAVNGHPAGRAPRATSSTGTAVRARRRRAGP